METQLTIRLPSKLLGSLRKISKKVGLKRSDLVRFAIQRLVEQESQVSPSDFFSYQKVSSLVGSISTGIPDLGVNHREHLLRKIKRHAPDPS